MESAHLVLQGVYQHFFFQNGKKHLKQQHEQDAHRYDNRNSWRPRQSLRLKTSVASFAVCISGKTSSYNTSDAC